MCPPSDITASTSTAQPRPIDTTNIVPETSISKSAYEHAASLLAPSILIHSIRVYLYATALAKHTNSIYFTDTAKHDLLFTACLFHDIGTTSTYDGPLRFEIEGGNAAVKHLSQFGMSETDKHDVWTAIAIHTSPQIAEHIGELSRIMHIAVITDFSIKSELGEVLEPMREKLEKDFERCGIEKVLSDAVVEQAKSRPEKAPIASWPGMLYQAHLAGPEGEGNKAFGGT